MLFDNVLTRRIVDVLCSKSLTRPFTSTWPRRWRQATTSSQRSVSTPRRRFRCLCARMRSGFISASSCRSFARWLGGAFPKAKIFNFFGGRETSDVFKTLRQDTDITSIKEVFKWMATRFTADALKTPFLLGSPFAVSVVCVLACLLACFACFACFACLLSCYLV